MMSHGHRYVVVGLACALLHNAVMIGGDLLGIHYVVSTLISYFVVVVFGFALHCGFTFSQPSSVRVFLRYAAGMATNYPASIVLMFLFCDGAGLSVAVAAPLTTVLLFAWNYLAARWAIVRRPAAKEAA